MSLTRTDELAVQKMLGIANVPDAVVAHYDRFRRIRDRVRPGDTPTDVLALICVMAGMAPAGGDSVNPVTIASTGQAIDWSRIGKGQPLWYQPPVDADGDGSKPPEVEAEYLSNAGNGKASIRVYNQILEMIEEVPYRTLRIREGVNWARVIDEAPIAFTADGEPKEGLFLGRRFNGDLTIKLGGKGQRERIVPPWEVALVDDPKPVHTPKA